MKLEDEIIQAKFKNEYHKAVVNLIFTSNWLEAINAGFLKPYDITPQQFNILRILRGQKGKPVSIKIIKERMLDKMSDVSRLTDKLKAKGLADRTVNANDRRNVDIVITQKGLDILSEIDNQGDVLEAKLRNLNETEINQLNDLLDKLRG